LDVSLAVSAEPPQEPPDLFHDVGYGNRGLVIWL
jgi:hypothetical protein